MALTGTVSDIKLLMLRTLGFKSDISTLPSFFAGFGGALAALDAFFSACCRILIRFLSRKHELHWYQVPNLSDSRSLLDTISPVGSSNIKFGCDCAGAALSELDPIVAAETLSVTAWTASLIVSAMLCGKWREKENCCLV
jgi:hypothetical protein